MDFKKEYLCKWFKHDDISCNALREYDNTVDYLIGISPYKHMQMIANKHETTIAEMKKHWRCIENR